MARGWEASSLEGSPNGGRVPAPPCLLVKMTEGEGAAVPSPREAVLACLCRCTSPPRPVPWVQALSASVPSPVGGAMLLRSWRLYETISESGCWRSPVSVPQRGLWAAWSQAAVSSRAGCGHRAECPIGGWSVGSHNQAPELAVSSRSRVCSQQLLGTLLCTWGRCVCLYCGRGAPGLLDPSGARASSSTSASVPVCDVHSTLPSLIYQRLD